MYAIHDYQTLQHESGLLKDSLVKTQYLHMGIGIIAECTRLYNGKRYDYTGRKRVCMMIQNSYMQ